MEPWPLVEGSRDHHVCTQAIAGSDGVVCREGRGLYRLYLYRGGRSQRTGVGRYDRPEKKHGGIFSHYLEGIVAIFIISATYSFGNGV